MHKLTYLINYINTPETTEKLASIFPQANGTPSYMSKVSNLNEAAYILGRNTYMHRKQSALISSGLDSLKEVSNG